MTHDLLTDLRPLLTAEASAEAHATGTEPGDLEQAVWLRLLERLDAQDPPLDPHGWLRRAVRTESRRNRRTNRRERPYGGERERPYGSEPEQPYGCEPAEAGDRSPEQLALAAARRRALHDAVRRLPGRCPRLMEALLSPRDLTYREIAGELGISQGSLGPERSRCLECLRRLLTQEVAAHEARG
ncbi:RNA polymerase sigma factor (sigma-70 family) [Streptomyces sp. LBL]|uniref:RNA polymerase sigma factor n=1 Tax=Streptomyces sp. LBL TaxID=2940562 RepID=UPI0024758813|nr:sigma-70 family RNA polymerase sigma factor [Streptomyces sp. LBL]MDH6630216.1 RNA polymerase sigma factor (sigma-70 family) [Streptomyces sp. LBL]